MSDHTPAQLARILAPVWTAAPDAIPRNGDESLSVGWFGDWQWHVQDGPLNVERAVVSNEVARNLILACLQMAIEARVFAGQGSVCFHRNALGEVDATGTIYRVESDICRGVSNSHARHPDPILARAQLLAKIVGVELGVADA